MMKDFCKSWYVHTTLNNGQTFCRFHKFSLKAVLLHNRCIHPSIPIAHTVYMKEIHKNMDLLLTAISYSRYGWKICGVLHGVGLLLGIQSGYTKFCCFLCEGYSQAEDKHYKMKDWPMQKNSVPGKSV